MSDLIHIGNGVFEEKKAPTFNTLNENPTSFRATAQVHNTTYSNTSGGGEASSQGIHRFSAVSSTKENDGLRNYEGSTSSVSNGMSEDNGDIMSTVLSSTGSPTANIKGTSTVAYAGTRISLDTAVTLGVVVKNADGTYSATQSNTRGQSNVDNGSTQGDTQGQPEVNVNADDVLPLDVTNKITALQQNIPEVYLDKSVAQFTANFDVTPEQIERMANDSGLPMASVHGTFTDVQHAFQTQADKVVTKVGVDPQAFYSWAKANRVSELQNAVREQVYMKKTSAYKVLAEQYKRTVR